MRISVWLMLIKNCPRINVGCHAAVYIAVAPKRVIQDKIAPEQETLEWQKHCHENPNDRRVLTRMPLS